jgi:hypothetical protein
MSDKLINTFHLRRKLHADFEALGETSSEAELYEQVRAIIHKYEPELILTTLRRFLDTSSSQLRGGTPCYIASLRGGLGRATQRGC